MKQKTIFTPPTVGGSSLLVIFAVLCFSLFAMLSLATVRTEQRLSETCAAAVTAYYQAENQAESIYAQLRQGQIPSGVAVENDLYRFSCRISENQQLNVTLTCQAGAWRILRWQAEGTMPASVEEKIPVWDGTGGDDL